jgi:pyruvate/2-oxoacid:ferredoxin oxidoreductase beta subunit
MTKDQALRLALEALEYPGPSWIEARQPAITAIKQALAQPEPEPVAWTDIDFTNIYISEMVAKEKSADVPLYTSPPKREWQGLSDDEIDQGLLRSNYAFKTAEAWHAGVVFAMTKLKEKNT